MRIAGVPVQEPSVGVGDPAELAGKTIEAHQFLTSIVTGVQGEPGFREALRVARVQEAVIRSWDSERREPVAAEE